MCGGCWTRVWGWILDCAVRKSKLPKRLPPGTYTARVVDVRVRKVRNRPYRKMTVELQVLLPKEHGGEKMKSSIGIGGD